MKLKAAPDDLLERIALRMNLAPMPAAYAMYGMVAGRIVGVAQRLGVFAKLQIGEARTVLEPGDSLALFR